MIMRLRARRVPRRSPSGRASWSGTAARRRTPSQLVEQFGRTCHHRGGVAGRRRRGGGAAGDGRRGCPVVLSHEPRRRPRCPPRGQAGVVGFLVKPLRAEELGPSPRPGGVALPRGRPCAWRTRRLKRTLEARKLIERAKGVLMQRLGLSRAGGVPPIQKTAMDTRQPHVRGRSGACSSRRRWRRPDPRANVPGGAAANGRGRRPRIICRLLGRPASLPRTRHAAGLERPASRSNQLENAAPTGRGTGTACLSIERSGDIEVRERPAPRPGLAPLLTP